MYISSNFLKLLNLNINSVFIVPYRSRVNNLDGIKHHILASMFNCRIWSYNDKKKLHTYAMHLYIKPVWNKITLFSFS